MNNVIEGQNKEMFKEFISFCDKQPKDKEINHYDGWVGCAVGQFLNYTSVFESYLDEARRNLLLGKKSDLYRLVDSGQCPNTYGEFTEFLREWL